MNDVQDLHRQMFKSVMDHDYATLRDLYAPGYAYRGPDGQPGDVDMGVGVAEGYGAAFPDLQFEIERQWSPSPDVSIIEFTARGTHTGPLGELPPTGKSAEVVGCNIVEARDGKIVREREYVDTMTLMRQLGVVS